MAWDSSNFDPTTNTLTLTWNTGRPDTFSYAAVVMPGDTVGMTNFTVAANSAQMGSTAQFYANVVAANNAAATAAAALTQAQNSIASSPSLNSIAPVGS